MKKRSNFYLLSVAVFVTSLFLSNFLTAQISINTRSIIYDGTFNWEMRAKASPVGFSILGSGGPVNNSLRTSDGSNSLFNVAHPSDRVVAIGGNNDHVFHIGGFQNNLSAFTPRMTILTDGNVGIGTTTPFVKLEVVGDAKIIGKLVLDSGGNNIFIGKDAGVNNDPEPTFYSGSRNIFIGENAGKENTSGYENTFIGVDAGEYNTTSISNAFFGSRAGKKNTEGSGNSFFGSGAGVDNTTGGDNSFFGTNAGSDANNTKSTLLGFNAETVDSLDRAIAIGYNAIVDCHNCAVIGGTGVDAVNVGIGTTNPITQLDVVGDVLIERGEIQNSLTRILTISGARNFNTDPYASLNFRNLDDDTNTEYTGAKITSHNDDGTENGDLRFFTRDNEDIAVRFTINNTGGSFVGSTYQNRSFIHSDKRFKKSIRPIENPMALLHRINGVSYEMRTDEYAARSFSTDRQLGVIAQEIENVFPELVTTLADGYKAVNYDGLIPVLIEGMKAQQMTITALEEKAQANESLLETVSEQQIQIDDQQQQIDDQQQQIDEMKSLVEKLLAQKVENSQNSNHELHLEKAPSLNQNHPNPFRENTLVNYFIPSTAQNAHIQVTSVDSKVLGTVNIPEKGQGQVTIKAATYPAGTYYYSLIVDGEVFETKRMVLTK